MVVAQGSICMAVGEDSFSKIFFKEFSKRDRLESVWSFIRQSFINLILFQQGVISLGALKKEIRIAKKKKKKKKEVPIHQGGLSSGGLSQAWSHRVVFQQGVIYLGCPSSGSLKNHVPPHQCGLSSRRSFTGLVFDQGGLSSWWSLIRMVSHHGGLSSRWSRIMVVSHQGGLS